MIVDAADSFAVTYILSDACHAAAKPLVSASVIGLTGYAGAFCGGGPSYRAVFPEVSIDGGTCATVGVLGTAVAILGSVQAHLVLHLLLGLEPTVLGRVVTFDARRLTFGGFGFEGSPEPEGAVPFIAPAALLPTISWSICAVLDEAPRTFAEGRRVDVAGIDAIATELPASRRIVLCCRSGQRALMAADRLRDRGLRHCPRCIGLRSFTMAHTTDQTVLNHIEQLVAEEKTLYHKGEISDAEKQRLAADQRGTGPLLGPAAPAPCLARVRQKPGRRRGPAGEDRRELSGLTLN